MRKISISLTILIAILISCSSGLKPILNQSIYLIKDKDGLYLFDFKSQTEKLIFKALDNQVFLDEPILISNDTLTFGIKGELIFNSQKDTNSFVEGETYSKIYYSQISTSDTCWISKEIFYEVIGHDTLKIKTQIFNSYGQITFETDTSMRFKGASTTYKGVTFNYFKPRFYTIHTNYDKSVFSLRGNIYLAEGVDTTLLVEFKGNFDPKFGSGYFQPQLDPTNTYVVFRYLPGSLNLIGKPSLQKIDLNSKKMEIIKKGNFVSPSFSNDGNFILFKRNEREGKRGTWISDIYLLDLTTLKEKKISEAYSASWIIIK
jgi:hypothetical protein